MSDSCAGRKVELFKYVKWTEWFVSYHELKSVVRLHTKSLVRKGALWWEL